MNMLIGCLILFVLSLGTTFAFRTYAIRTSLLDKPNERSSHMMVTPKGGGIVFVAGYLFITAYFFITSHITQYVFLSLFAGGFLIAFIGWAADRGYHNIYGRLGGQIAATLIAIIFLSARKPVDIATIVPLGVLGYIFVFLVFMWLINLYNFMDGIDGIAAIEAITFFISTGFFILPLYPNMAKSAFFLTALIVGFLFWNFHSKKIFMGDVGSGFLGFISAVWIFFLHQEIESGFWIALILLGVFCVDATITLVVRIIDGSKWHTAHRRHAYQHASQLYSHKIVSSIVGIINIFWLLPLAYSAYKFPKAGFLIWILAWIPLSILAFKFRAGKKEGLRI